MNARTLRHTATSVAIFLPLLISGCLSDVKPAPSGFNPDDPGPGPSGTNNPPTISGNPPSAITVGDEYSFTPNASDPDNDPLTFSVQNRPSWASFDSSTGTLSGTPTLGNVGSYSDIEISVSDGSDSATLGAFPVEVVQATLGSVTLTWEPPTQNADGSTLDDLVAYKFYFGTESGNYDNVVRVDSPGMATYVVENLAPNTYYFVLTAINNSGVESAFSNEAIKQVL